MNINELKRNSPRPCQALRNFGTVIKKLNYCITKLLITTGAKV
jgi:hypothetical protein